MTAPHSVNIRAILFRGGFLLRYFHTITIDFYPTFCYNVSKETLPCLPKTKTAEQHAPSEITR